ncbi:MAG: oxidative damage protection protein, partial [Alcanivoracaceae bacterium]
MTRTVFCRKYEKELEGLERPPFPGPRGEDIYENVSRDAWQAWLKEQTMLINEKHLNVMDPHA